jgi:hypothetical protein
MTKTELIAKIAEKAKLTYLILGGCLKKKLLAIICSLFTLTTLSASTQAASGTLQSQNLNSDETRALKKGGNVSNKTKALKKAGNVASETKAIKKEGRTNNQQGALRGQAGDNIGTRPQGINQGR